MSFLILQEKRRSIYAIGKEVSLSEEEIVSLVKETMKQAPSSFNSQSSRAVILFGEESEYFWNELTATELQKVTTAEAFGRTKQKLASFAAGVGTILLFEDQEVVQSLERQFPSYAPNFSIWSEHAHGINLYAIWLAFAEKEIGMTVQHYNPLVDEAVAARYEVPASWKLRAQVPFGSIVAPAGVKTYIADEERVRVVKR